MSLEETAVGVAYGVLAGIIYGTIWFARRKAQTTPVDGEVTFDPQKFAATLIVGALVGGANGAMGLETGQESIEAKIVANAGLIALAEGVIHGLNDTVNK